MQRWVGREMVGDFLGLYRKKKVDEQRSMKWLDEDMIGMKSRVWKVVNFVGTCPIKQKACPRFTGEVL